MRVHETRARRTRRKRVQRRNCLVANEIAAAWVENLRARGVTVELRRNRVWLQPASAYHELSDEEMLTLRHHRAAIKAVLSGNARPVKKAEGEKAGRCAF